MKDGDKLLTDCIFKKQKTNQISQEPQQQVTEKKVVEEEKKNIVNANQNLQKEQKTPPLIQEAFDDLIKNDLFTSVNFQNNVYKKKELNLNNTSNLQENNFYQKKLEKEVKKENQLLQISCNK